MRVVVPLQGVLQGRGGLVLGTLLPGALFYFLQIYLKRHRTPPSSPRSPPDEPAAATGGSGGGGGSGIVRSLSRGVLSPRASYPPVSFRAAAIGAEEESLYYAGNRRCNEDQYDAAANPNGIMQLGLAENRLCLDLIDRWMEENAAAALLGGCCEGRCAEGQLGIRGLATYKPFDGLMDLKMAIARFMNQVMGGSVYFNPSQMVLTSGATSAIETLSFCLADSGNAFLVPSPYYPGFDRDVRWRAGVELIPVPCRSTDNFGISVAALERAYNQASKRGVRVRALLITNPSNPTGTILEKETLYGLLEFAAEKNIHLISDEVFASSTYGKRRFVSMAEVLDSSGSEGEDDSVNRSRVHIIYGLSKDLSLAGFRAGVIYSYNEAVVATAVKMARFSPISAPTQTLLVSMLSDAKFVSEYQRANQQRLRTAYLLLVDGLAQVGVKCLESEAGFYCWADMSKFIESYSEKGERKLWQKLLEEAKINMTPGAAACHCIEPGWFRCCFTTLQEDDVPVLVQRLRRVLTENHRLQHR